MLGCSPSLRQCGLETTLTVVQKEIVLEIERHRSAIAQHEGAIKIETNRIAAALNHLWGDSVPADAEGASQETPGFPQR